MSSSERPSRFIFYCVSPFLIASMFTLPFIVNQRDWTVSVSVCLMEVFFVALFFTLYDPHRFWMMGKVTAGLIFFGCSSYLIAMIYEGNWVGQGKRSETTVVNAIFAMIAFGFPSLSYLIYGRLGWRKEEEIPDDIPSDEYDSSYEVDCDPSHKLKN